MFPFGRVMVKRERIKQEDTLILVSRKSLWLVVGWLPLASVHIALGIVLCSTILALPFGMEHFSIAQFLLSPFRYKVMREGSVRIPSDPDLEAEDNDAVKPKETATDDNYIEMPPQEALALQKNNSSTRTINVK